MNPSGAAAGQALSFSAAPRGREVRPRCPGTAPRNPPPAEPCASPWLEPFLCPIPEPPTPPSSAQDAAPQPWGLHREWDGDKGAVSGRRCSVPSAGGMQRSRHSQGQHLSPPGQPESSAQSGGSRRKQRRKSRGHLPGFWESPALGWQCQDSARAPHPPSPGKQGVGPAGARELEQGLQPWGLQTSLLHGPGLLDPHRETCMAQHSVTWHGTVRCGTSATRSVTGPVW